METSLDALEDFFPDQNRMWSLVVRKMRKCGADLPKSRDIRRMTF